MSLYQDHEGSRHGAAAQVSISHEDRAAAAQDAAIHLQRAHASRIRVAQQKVIAIAMELAADGISAALIAESMRDMAEDASKRAAKYIAEYDRLEAIAIANDIEDMKDDYAYGDTDEVDS